MVYTTSFFAALSALSSIAAVGSAKPTCKAKVKPLGSTTVFTPPEDYTDPRTLYARTVQLPNDDLLLTWENYSPEPPPVYFPVYRSRDKGATWREISRVHDQGLGHGLRYQPQLYVLPERVGEFGEGTLLLAGSSIPTDLSSTQLDIYASTDDGLTWEFLSHVAAGGRAVPNNGLTPVWEPFMGMYTNISHSISPAEPHLKPTASWPPIALDTHANLFTMAHEGKLIYYYADQRANETHGQKLSHQTSADLRTWGPAVDDVAYPTYTDRPGMPTVAALPDGRFIYVYEYGGGPNPARPGAYTFPVHYRLSADPEDFASAPHHLLRSSTDGAVPDGSPYVVWTPAGGPNGTVVVSSGCCSEVWVNRALGAEDAWETVGTPEPASYTRSLLVFREDPEYVLISGAGKLPPSTTNKVSVSVIKVP
ncbi:hypothetical protein DL765_011518 [Monosporascus sp. GIB2]|nr:hypothetical protein DL765_011518 [Monosporascus sp. GIB2]